MSPADLEASILARLRNYARQHNKDFNASLQFYAVERFLYRLAESPHRDDFVLKGGMAFLVWNIPLRRPTRDIDLRGFMRNDLDQVTETIRSICRQPVKPDGIQFDAGTVAGESIQKGAQYRGIRIKFTGQISTARTSMQLDINFHDEIMPPALDTDYPTLLPEMPAPHLRSYPPEVAIAEKLQAMVLLGDINSRLKDYHDIWLLAQNVKIEGETLCTAITSTFQRRKTPLPDETPFALTDDFAGNRQIEMWAALQNRNGADALPITLQQAIIDIRAFAWPPLQAVANRQKFNQQWKPGGPWHQH